MTDSSSLNLSPSSHVTDKAAVTAAPITNLTPTQSPGGSTPGHHATRRSLTMDESAQVRTRRQPSVQLASDCQWDSPGNSGGCGMRRRSSTFSEYSLNEARRGLQDDLLNPGGSVGLGSTQQSWASIPLAFALLPALGGVMFKNGSHHITDIMLLSLAAVFLHWSVTQPWRWYYSAQEIRVREETIAEIVIEDESEGGSPRRPSTPSTTRTLDDVPEEVGGPGNPKLDEVGSSTEAANERARQARWALNELYAHEVLALISCFSFPIVGAYLLHAIRNQLSRQSDGLVSNFNLAIFVLAAEIHPLTHLMKLVQARTLHLQRVVNANPFREEHERSVAQVEAMTRRIEELEMREESRDAAAATAAQNRNGGATASAVDSAKQQARQTAAITRDVRNAIQPELDALNRAVRRYEKKAMVLAFQTEARLGQIDTRLGDAVALAAVAVKHSASVKASRSSVLSWISDWVLWMVAFAMFPFTTAYGVLILPFRTLAGLFFSTSRNRNRAAYGGSVDGRRDRRAGMEPLHARMNSSDRVPSRLYKR